MELTFFHKYFKKILYVKKIHRTSNKCWQKISDLHGGQNLRNNCVQQEKRGKKLSSIELVLMRGNCEGRKEFAQRENQTGGYINGD